MKRYSYFPKPLVKDHKPKSKSKSIEFHKKKILARLNSRKDYIAVSIMQSPARFSSGLSCRSLKSGACNYILVTRNKKIGIHGIYSAVMHSMNKYPVYPHFKLARALRYLVEEGRIKVSMSDDEWKAQLALGFNITREYTLVRPDVSSNLL